MPTKKPRIQSILETDTYNKLKVICDNEMRTESKMISYIVTQYIKQYEQEHGTIQIDETN